MYDEDMVRDINNESYAEYLDTQSMKRKILGMANPEKKQEAWRKLFPAPIELEANEVF